MQGRIRAAIACHRRAEAVKPDYTTVASNVLFNCHFAPGFDDAALREEQRRWRRRHAQRLEGSVKPHTNDPSPGRRLRIGYVSPDFRAHCQAFFTVPLFENHDQSVAQIYCYSDVRRPDDLTMHLRSFADQWRSIVGVADDQVANMIRADQIDILVDLTMHMADNRLLVFARKPAPVQVTWLAYPGTTGLEAIDYRLSDPQLDPPGQDTAHYSEKTVTHLASDLPRLCALRATLRQRMERSALMDAPRFARAIEGAYRDMWQRWCVAREPVQLATDI